MKKLLLLLISMVSFAVQADPAPFGLEINKTTTAELKNAFEVSSLGNNKNNELEAFEIDPKNINFEGLISIKAAFSTDGILKLIQMSIPSAKFEDLEKSLEKKYTLVYKNAPTEGNKEAKFEKDQTYILLYAPQNSAEMDFLYINKKILDDTLAVKPNDTLAKKEHEDNL